MRVDFYHLTRTPVERALPRIAERVIGEGGRLLVVSADAEQRRTIDRVLWSFSPESFIPHAEAGSGDDRLQAVLLSEQTDATNGARHIALIDGQWRDAAFGFDRALHFFADEHVDASRTAWRALGTREGIQRAYWRQRERGWEKAG